MKLSVFSLLAAPLQLAIVNAAINIMPLGDSITEITCWRPKLWSLLQQASYTAQIDFIGSVTTPSTQCPTHPPFDLHNEGHAGYQAINIANQNQLVGWLQPTKPDIITMHLGTVDTVYRRSVPEIITAFDKLLSQMRTRNPEIYVLVAKIIPLGAGFTDVRGLNGEIEKWANRVTTKRSPMVLVDQWTGYVSDLDNYDGIHPGDSGDVKIADKWFGPLVTAIEWVLAKQLV
ncbi:SGNH hydrolase [Ascobolus immersus RN42]|uniref:SGNH hydrolase n=1 Tax=Ascobolus immersus RN42 TaxID=1160509 RepID=A0A3N4IFU2_ASCIM|nr:SGNH hydrolase [Ascobolus immersus RN42]